MCWFEWSALTCLDPNFRLISALILVVCLCHQKKKTCVCIQYETPSTGIDSDGKQSKPDLQTSTKISPQHQQQYRELLQPVSDQETPQLTLKHGGGSSVSNDYDNIINDDGFVDNDYNNSEDEPTMTMTQTATLQTNVDDDERMMMRELATMVVGAASATPGVENDDAMRSGAITGVTTATTVSEPETPQIILQTQSVTPAQSRKVTFEEKETDNENENETTFPDTDEFEINKNLLVLSDTESANLYIERHRKETNEDQTPIDPNLTPKDANITPKDGNNSNITPNDVNNITPNDVNDNEMNKNSIDKSPKKQTPQKRMHRRGRRPAAMSVSASATTEVIFDDEMADAIDKPPQENDLNSGNSSNNIDNNNNNNENNSQNSSSRNNISSNGTPLLPNIREGSNENLEDIENENNMNNIVNDFRDVNRIAIEPIRNGFTNKDLCYRYQFVKFLGNGALSLFLLFCFVCVLFLLGFFFMFE